MALSRSSIATRISLSDSTKSLRMAGSLSDFTITFTRPGTGFVDNRSVACGRCEQDFSRAAVSTVRGSCHPCGGAFDGGAGHACLLALLAVGISLAVLKLRREDHRSSTLRLRAQAMLTLVVMMVQSLQVALGREKATSVF